MDWVRYLKDKENFLASVYKTYSFASRCSAKTLWDILWGQHNSSNGCSGTLADFIEKEYEYIAEQAKEGGESRDRFVDWLGYCDKCHRGKKLVPEKEKELREEFARAEVDDDLNSFFKGETEKSKHRDSKYHVPIRFDFIEDPDDDIGVAHHLNMVEYTPAQQAKLTAIGKKKEQATIEVGKKKYGEWEFWARVYTAQWLIEHLESFTPEKDGTETDVSKVKYLCPDCYYPLLADEDARIGNCPFRMEMLACGKCSNEVFVREAAGWAAALLEGEGWRYCYETNSWLELLTARTPPMPFEKGYDPAKNFITRIKAMPHRKLVEKLEGLWTGSARWTVDRAHSQTTLGVPVKYLVGPEGVGALSMMFYCDGWVLAGPTFPYDEENERRLPIEAEILFAREAIVAAGLEEVSQEGRMYGH